MFLTLLRRELLANLMTFCFFVVTIVCLVLVVANSIFFHSKTSATEHWKPSMTSSPVSVSLRVSTLMSVRER